jgi:hypothetical protein
MFLELRCRSAYATVTDPAFHNQNFCRQWPVQSQEGFSAQKPPGARDEKCEDE